MTLREKIAELKEIAQQLRDVASSNIEKSASITDEQVLEQIYYEAHLYNYLRALEEKNGQ
jgi:hypothetical protein